MEKSIELNDQRAVYRSRLLLDDDNAFRNAGLGSLYQQLGFEQLGTSLAADSLAEDPTNPAAHRLLADSYLDNHRSNVARVNEIRQAQLFGGIGQQIIQPQLLRAHKTLLDDGGPNSLGYNEYNRLLQSNGPYVNLSATGAGNNTWGNDLTTGYITDKYALHLGQYHYETDGFSTSTGYEEDSSSFQLQWQIHNAIRFELDAGKDESERQSAGMRYTEDFINPTRRTENNDDKYGASLVFNFSQSDKLVLRSSVLEGDSNTKFLAEQMIGFPQDFDVTNSFQHKREHIQYSHSGNKNSLVIGSQRTRKENTNVHTLNELYDDCFFDGCAYTYSSDSEAEDRRYYGYWYARAPEQGLTVTGGLEIVREVNKESAPGERTLLPKFGVGVRTPDGLKFNLAVFRALSSAVDANRFETLAPTQIAGFNQIFTGQLSSISDNYGISFEKRMTPTLRSGLRYAYHKGTSVLGQLSFSNDGSFGYLYKDVDTKIETTSAWLYWTPLNRLSLSLEFLGEQLEDQQEQLFNLTSDNVEKLDTTKIPLTVSYHHPLGFSFSVTGTHINQKGKLWESATAIAEDSPIYADESFTLVDLNTTYRLPKRHGTISLGVKNLFDEEFNFEDASSYNSLAPQDTGVPSIYAASRLIFATASFSF